MLTNDFLGDNIARLGFGAMRLPIIDGDASNVDQATLDAMVDTAIKEGINYFDTAYPYHGGMSEIALGRSLARYPRDRYFFADELRALSLQGSSTNEMSDARNALANGDYKDIGQILGDACRHAWSEAEEVAPKPRAQVVHELHRLQVRRILRIRLTPRRCTWRPSRGFCGPSPCRGR